jgi:hypothetical protein
MRRLGQPRTRTGSFDPRRAIIGASALVAVSSAWALGAWAISFLVVRRVRVGHLKIRELEVDHLTVGRLDVRILR